jgi:hypothetical protein
MLLIILLGAITKLAMISADCDIADISLINQPLSLQDRTKVSSSVTPHNVVNVRMCNQSELIANVSYFIIVYRYLVLAVLLVPRERQ